MTESKRPLKIFLCHAKIDKPQVRELYRYLRKRGIKPWFDEEDLIGGQDWQTEIPKAIATSDAIIVCLTKNSVDNEGYVQKEIKFALDKALEMPEGRIYLIPVRLEECDVPYSLSRYQYVDLYIENGFPRLMRSLKVRASQLERTTIQLPKSNETQPSFVPVELQAPELSEFVPALSLLFLRETLSKFFTASKSSLLKALPLLKIVGVIGIVVILFWAGSWAISRIITSWPTEQANTPTPIASTKFIIGSASESPTEAQTAILTKTNVSTLTPESKLPLTPSVSSTPTALMLTFCTWKEQYFAGSHSIRSALHECMCNDDICFCTEYRYNSDGDVDWSFQSQETRSFVDWKVSTELKGKCYIK